MAPQGETAAASSGTTGNLALKATPIKNALALEVKHQPIEHPEFAHTFPKVSYPPIPELPYEDRALKADPTFKNLLANATITHLEPKIGSEISGIQLHELTDEQKDELALLVAERGVVFFRDQEITVDQQLDLGRYYGPLHIHQSFGHPEGYPELHVVHNTVETSKAFLKRHSLDPLTMWHSDVTYERQPPSYTSLKVVTVPDVGGDTLWSSSYEAYERLTPPFKAFLEGLTAIHSSKQQAEFAVALGQFLRRPVVEFAHPVVRTHPVTGRKALFVNPAFTTRIVELSSAESDAVLKFLYQHIGNGHEFQVRFRWTKNSIAIWDNRITTHYATFDYLPGNRQAVRVTPQGEIPFATPTP